MQVFVNDECTRTFLALPLAAGRDPVLAMIRAVDTVLIRFRGAPYYADPQPHVSLLSWPGDLESQVTAQLDRLQSLCPELGKTRVQVRLHL